jgi:hypothetical protein
VDAIFEKSFFFFVFVSIYLFFFSKEVVASVWAAFHPPFLTLNETTASFCRRLWPCFFLSFRIISFKL